MRTASKVPDDEPTVVSIHDHELPEKRAFDLQDILRALGQRGLGWNWCVLYDFEAYGPGEDLRERTQAIWQARPGGLWLSGPELVEFAQGIHQTIDGEFQAFPACLDPQSIPLGELRTSFPGSRAQLVIRITDSAIFEVYAKHPEDVARLRARFADVRLEEDTGRYC